MDTVSTHLEWECHYMVNYPEIQDKMFEEIQANIGSRQATLSDRPNTPYVDAVIEEVMR